MMSKSVMARRTARLFAATCLAALALPAIAQTAPADPIESGFRDPPASARPRVWWHWMNGNITKDGIRDDLAWMKRVGIGGLQNFDANLTTPRIVDKRLVYMTPDWKDAFRFVASEAERQGLELAIASSPGWSETGGPWVPAVDGMKKLVWSETTLKGGRAFKGALPTPPSASGPYLDLATRDDVDALTGPISFKPPILYRDVAVLAYPIATSRAPAMPRFSDTDGKPLDAAALTDDSLATIATIAIGTKDKPAMVRVDYDRPERIGSLSLFAPGTGPSPLSPGYQPRLEASDDGAAWRTILDIDQSAVPSTVSFPTVTARHFRIVFARKPGNAAAAAFSLPPGLDLSGLGAAMFAGGKGAGIKVAQLRLSGEAKTDLFEMKAGFALTPDYFALPAHAPGDEAGVDAKSVIDLTASMKPDGTLDWTPPKGNWRIVRLGWSLTGKTNHPATDEATGLEVDKMDPAAVERYLDHYLGMYRDTVGPDLLGAKGVRAFLTDSTEVATFNWTPAMIGEFTRLRGYDPTPWLPTLTGAVIGTRARTDAFLYDFRRTIADLHASAHYGTVAKVAHANGLKVYGEALESGRPSLGDDMAMRSHTDYPMAAMWFHPSGKPAPASYLADDKGASSVAHIYGQNIAAAESMTSVLSPWSNAPADLRHVIDLEFALGINRPVIHTSVHQPTDDKIPGLSLSIFGQYFNRHETWAEMARPWIDYMARNAFLLQQGRNVADIAYFYGEEAPLTGLYGEKPVADAPTHYAFDFINADALLTIAGVDSTAVTVPSGARYRAIYLGGSSRRMTLPVLKRLAALAEAGATIIGDAPTGSPGLADDMPENRAAYAALVAKLWGGQPVTTVGKGRVIAGQQVEAALGSIGVTPDFAVDKPDSDILFVHRKLDDGDLYFVDNRRTRAEAIEAQFRVTGKIPELWHADTGLAEPVSYRIVGDRTIVPLALAPEESIFVVFRKAATADAATIATPAPRLIADLSTGWDVAFQPDRGAPPSLHLATLASLSAQADPGVRYFSGVASYTRSFTLAKRPGAGQALWLDLGTIGDVAEVRVNGTLVGTAWHAPYRLDIAAAARAGRNSIEVRVADLWVNRLIGDAQPGVQKKITWTASPTYTARAPLRPSGLIGPVQLFGTTAAPARP